MRRYYHLLIFQAYLDDTSPDEEDPYTFESFVKHRPVFKTLETELEHGGLQGLTPIERVDPAQGMAVSCSTPTEFPHLISSCQMRCRKWSPTGKELFCLLRP